MSLRTAISVTPSSYTITEYVAPSDSGFWICCVLGIYIVSVTYLMHMHAIYSGYHIKQLCHNICHEHKYRSNNQLIPVHECDSSVKFQYWFYLKCLLLSMSPWWSVTFILRSGVVKVLPIWKIVRKANDAMHGCSVTRPFLIHMCTGPCSSSCPDVVNIQSMIYVNVFLQCAVKGVHPRSTGNHFMLEECPNYHHKRHVT